MRIPFVKMHGAGNDFVLVNDTDSIFPMEDIAWIQAIAARQTGVGCDGVILLQPAQAGADFRMRFINPDGSEVEMCGNGARCISRFAFDHNIVSETMAFETVAGLIRAEVLDDLIRLTMTAPADMKLDREFDLFGQPHSYHFVNSGVPHVVVRVDDLDAHDVFGAGAEIRNHSHFQPAGTNANFIRITGEQALSIRTYERGVEGETLACGTGMVASSLIAAAKQWVSLPVTCTCASGDQLVVDAELTDDIARNVTLMGPAVTVFEGVLDY